MSDLDSRYAICYLVYTCDGWKSSRDAPCGGVCRVRKTSKSRGKPAENRQQLQQFVAPTTIKKEPHLKSEIKKSSDQMYGVLNPAHKIRLHTRYSDQGLKCTAGMIYWCRQCQAARHKAVLADVEIYRYCYTWHMYQG